MAYHGSGELAMWRHDAPDRPSNRKMEPPNASHSRIALSAMASSTGWTSVGARLMTPRTSPVAVCRVRVWASSSLRALQFREQAHVLDRDHRLVGERLHELDLCIRERPDLHPVDQDRPECSPLSLQRRGEGGSKAVRFCNGRPSGVLVQLGASVADVHRPAVDDGLVR